MIDPQARHLRRLRRLRRSARRWSVLAGLLGGAAVVLAPYAGLGPADAAWAAAAGGSVALTWWRWLDLKAFATLPVPPPPDPALAAQRTRHRIEGLVNALPGGRDAIDELRRQRDRVRLRGSAVLPSWRRLDRASATLAGYAPRLGGAGEAAMLEAAVAERGLRDLADRTAGVERGLRFATGDSRDSLDQAHQALVGRFDEGVTAYEGLVAAAAAYLAEDGPAAGDPLAHRLSDAADLLRASAAGLAELRAPQPPPH